MVVSLTHLDAVSRAVMNASTLKPGRGKTATILLACLVYAASCLAASAEAVYVDTNKNTAPGAVFSSDGVTLTMRPGWIQIPPEQVQRVREELQQQAPKVKIPVFDYAYQEASDEWFSYPYVLITIHRTGRISERDLESWAKVDLTSAVDKVAKSASSVMTDASAGHMRYDESARVVWQEIETNLVDNQKIRGITAIIPTEFGLVRVHGYSRDADYARFAASFQRLIAEASIEETVRYKPHASDSLPGWVRDLGTPEVVKRALIGAILGLAGAGMALRKRKATSTVAGKQESP